MGVRAGVHSRRHKSAHCFKHAFGHDRVEAGLRLALLPAGLVPQPTERHADVLGELLALPGMGGYLVMNAHLAALAIEHGLTLCSNDGDFARFKKLRWVNPLE